MKPLFGSGFIDEIHLMRLTDDMLMAVDGNLSKEYLLQISTQYGIDTATVLLYNWIVNYKHRAFCRHIENLSTDIDAEPNASKVLIVPGMFYKEYPDMGGDGIIIKSIAEKFSFEVEIVPTLSTGDVSENANIITRHIQNAGNASLWIISISKGSADTGRCLQHLDKNGLSNIHGWISLCGIFNGSPMADIRLKNPLSKFLLKSYLALHGANYRSIEEMRPDNPLWSKKLDSFDGHFIHIHPMPVAAYVHAKLIKRYRQLASLGPNDGTVLLDDLIERRGHIYPLWGVDHFFRDRAVIPLIYKLCRHIKSLDKQRKSNDENIKQMGSARPAIPVYSF